MPKTYRFPCGCSFLIDDSLPPIHGHPSITYPQEAHDLPEDCSMTWEMLGEGQTKGVFQLESPLGRQWTKKLKPGNLEHLSALGAILRPGALKALDEKGISMTEHYCRRKNGEEEATYFHPSLESILGSTYACLVYQEQSMAIAVKLAGFSPMEADDLRKAIGKKKTDVMAKVKTQFVNKAEALGIITRAQAEEIFGWIEKSARYQFNKSHALSYALISYNTAHLKAHFPIQFYTSFLYYAKEKQDPLLEMRQLINDAKLSGIQVLPPRFEDMNTNFTTDGVVITFGLSDVRSIGASHVAKMRANMEVVEKEVGIPRMEWEWLDFLTYFSPVCQSNVVKRMIEVGGMSRYKLDRQRMLAEYEAYSRLTKKEKHTLSCLRAAKYDYGFMFGAPEEREVTTAADAIECLLEFPKGVANKNRRDKVGTILKLLKNPPRLYVDTPEWVAKTEEECLGIPITCNRIDGISGLQGDTTCQEFREGKGGDSMVLAVDVQECREHRIQSGDNRGKTMAFLVISDQSGSLDDVCIFSEAWEKYGNLLHAGTTVELKGRRDHKRGSFVVEEVWKV